MFSAQAQSLIHQSSPAYSSSAAVAVKRVKAHQAILSLNQARKQGKENAFIICMCFVPHLFLHRMPDLGNSLDPDQTAHSKSPGKRGTCI